MRIPFEPVVAALVIGLVAVQPLVAPSTTPATPETLHTTPAAAPTAARTTGLDVTWETARAHPGRTSRPIPLDEETVVLGADWGGDEDATVELRTRRDGQWSGWTSVHVDDHEGPDPGSAEDGSDWSRPVVVLGASAVQFRTDAPGLSAMAVAVGAREGQQGQPEQQELRATPAAATTRPPIISRAQWGADESLRAHEPSYASTVRFAVVHHTDTTNNYARSDSARIVRGIYEYHVRGNKWWDIGYNFLVDRYGQIFEGRHGGIDKAVIGAHAGGFNAGAVGVAVIGDFESTPVPPAARSALEELLAWKFARHHVDPTGVTEEISGSDQSRFPRGDVVDVTRVSGHGDLSWTACPGSISDLVDSGQLARGIAGRLGQRVVTDAPDELFSSFGDPPTEVAVSTTDVADWQLQVRDSADEVVFSRRWDDRRGVTIAWNHRSADGGWVPEGTYDLVISAAPRSGASVPAIRVPLTLRWRGTAPSWPVTFNGGSWAMREAQSSGTSTARWNFGREDDLPFLGDWDGDGIDTPGVYRDGNWFLSNDLAGGRADVAFYYGGRTGDFPLVGDWDGDGIDTVGVIRGGTWHLVNAFRGGAADLSFTYGRVAPRGSDIPLVGDWDGDGDDTVGIVRQGTWHLRNTNTAGPGDTTFVYGRVGPRGDDIAIAGDWDGDGDDTVGIVRGNAWYLRRTNTGGAADTVFGFGGAANWKTVQGGFAETTQRRILDRP